MKDYQSLQVIVDKVKEKGFDIILSKNLSITLLVYKIFLLYKKNVKNQ